MDRKRIEDIRNELFGHVDLDKPLRPCVGTLYEILGPEKAEQHFKDEEAKEQARRRFSRRLGRQALHDPDYLY